jgi:hypothetical protein
MRNTIFVLLDISEPYFVGRSVHRRSESDALYSAGDAGERSGELIFGCETRPGDVARAKTPERSGAPEGCSGWLRGARPHSSRFSAASTE